MLKCKKHYSYNEFTKFEDGSRRLLMSQGHFCVTRTLVEQRVITAAGYPFKISFSLAWCRKPTDVLLFRALTLWEHELTHNSFSTQTILGPFGGLAQTIRGPFEGLDQTQVH